MTAQKSKTRMVKEQVVVQNYTNYACFANDNYSNPLFRN